MKDNADEILKLVQNKEINDGRWGDCLVEDGIDIAYKLEISEIKNLLVKVKELKEKESIRLIECLIEVENLNLFDAYLELGCNSSFDLQEIIVDGLRCWNLTDFDRVKLKKFTIELKGKSKLLDKIIDSI